MHYRLKPWMFVAGLAFALAGFWLWTLPANAQCGSSISNCKQCHEVKKEAPVNTKGEWHTAHAFGDFCEFCHAGNVKGKDKASAHTGLAAPLADVKASCQSCHPNDFNDRAQKYAAALGVTVGTGSGKLASAPPAATPPASANENCGPAAPAGGTLIDINKVYAGLDTTTPSNLGNMILLGMIGAVVVVAVALAGHYERPLPRALAAGRRLFAGLAPVPAAGEPQPGLAARVELRRLQPLLERSDPQTLRALEQLLADQRSGPRVLKALANLDLRALTALGDSDSQALAAMTSLLKAMR